MQGRLLLSEVQPDSSSPSESGTMDSSLSESESESESLVGSRWLVATLSTIE